MLQSKVEGKGMGSMSCNGQICYPPAREDQLVNVSVQGQRQRLTSAPVSPRLTGLLVSQKAQGGQHF